MKAVHNRNVDAPERGLPHGNPQHKWLGPQGDGFGELSILRLDSV